MSTFTVGQVLLASDTTTPCPATVQQVTGLDPTNCGAIISGESASLVDKVFGAGTPPTPISRDKLPQDTQTKLTECDGSSTCKFVAYDFDTSTGQKSDTLSHLIDTRMSTLHNAGVFIKEGQGRPPIFTTMPGYIFDAIYSFTATPIETSDVPDERYCARKCDEKASTCGGFNYEPVGKKCHLMPKNQETNGYKDGTVSYLREDNPSTAQGSNPAGTNLTGSGVWCGVQNIQQCNQDIANVITNTDIQSFSTTDLVSCAACPAKSVVRTGQTTWAVTNEIDTTTISTSSSNAIEQSQYTTMSAPNTTTVLTPGNFYKIRAYLPGSSFESQTFLYMKKIQRFNITERTRYWYMSGQVYSIPAGFYSITEMIELVNAAGTPGTFSFDGTRVTWIGTFVVIELAGALEYLGFVNRQSSRTDPATGTVTLVGNAIAQPMNSGGFFTYATYTQGYREDGGGMCAEVGNTYNNGEAAADKLPDMRGRKTRMFGTLGTDFTNMSLDPLKAPEVTYNAIPVDYVKNGFLLLNTDSGKYLPATSWRRKTPSSDTSSIKYIDPRYPQDASRTTDPCNVIPKDTSKGADTITARGYSRSGRIITRVYEWDPPDFYEGCDRLPEKTLPQKYKAKYNAFIFVIEPATYSDFYTEASDGVTDQPLVIYRPNESVPYIFNPGTEDFRVLRFPSQRVFESYVQANPSWAKYYNSYRALGRFRYNTLKEAMDCGAPNVGGPGGSYAFEEIYHDPKPQLTVYDQNFWYTTPFDSRVEIFDPTYGCADPDDPTAYTGGEYQKTVGTVTFCELCPAGTYSPPSNPRATSCTPCTQGKYCPAGAGAEQDCAVGYYCPTPAQQIECPAGSYCPPGVAAPIACVAGDYCPAKSTAATDCPAGEYCPQAPNNGPWGGSKVTCPAGNYCAARATAPTPCTDPNNPGTAFFCPPGTRTLNQCPAGKYCPNNSTAISCTPGHFCPYGTSEPVTCQGDSFYVPLGLSNIISISQFSTSQVLNEIFTGGSRCFECPSGLRANDTKTGCVCNAPLVWSAWTNECLPNCPAGKAANAAKTGCDTCGDGTYTPVEGLAKCIPCASNFGSTHNATKTGCVCTDTITGGTLEWNSTWNRCRVVCNDTHLPYWSRCYPKSLTATPISYTAPAPVAQYDCPNGSQGGGTYAKDGRCTKGAEQRGVTKGCLGSGCLFYKYCLRNWTQNGGANWSVAVYASTNRSCYRSTIVTYHTCPTCWRPAYYLKANPGPSDQELTIPTWIKDTTSNGIIVRGTDQTSAEYSDAFNPGSVKCVWNGSRDASCNSCPAVPEGGYTKTVDTSLSTATKVRCDMYNAPATPDPWGADGASPQVDASGNILLPSLVTQALSSIAPPAGNPNIPCVRGTYLETAGTPLSFGSDGEIFGTQNLSGPLAGNCKPCPLGTFCDAGYTAPYQCPAGAYCPTPAEFYSCSAGQICPAGSTTWGTCPQGFYCPSSADPTPRKCPAGKYCITGSTAPLDCNTGEYCPEGSTWHNSCPAGSYCSNPTVIEQCPVGKYCPAGTSVPRPCEAGNYCPVGSKVATPCDAGNYCPAQSSSQAACDAGYYCPDPATRVACPAGTYSNQLRQTVASACTECPAGFYCPYNGANTLSPLPCTVPKLCSIGTYCGAGSSSVNPCPVGHYCTTSGQKALCPGGYVCPPGTVTYGLPPVQQELNSAGTESCRVVCGRGTGLPSEWDGAICITTRSNGVTCDTIPNAPVTCVCQRSRDAGWIV